MREITIITLVEKKLTGLKYIPIQRSCPSIYTLVRFALHLIQLSWRAHVAVLIAACLSEN